MKVTNTGFFESLNSKASMIGSAANFAKSIADIVQILDGTTKPSLGYIDNPYELKKLGREKIDRFSFKLPAQYTPKTKAYLFMTKPDLNLTETGLPTDGAVLQSPYFTNLFKNDPEIFSMLQTTNPGSSGSPFILPITNEFSGMSIPDIALENYDTMETLRGNKITYARHTVKSKLGFNFSLNLKEDSWNTMYKVFKTWIDYMEELQRGSARPKRDYIYNKILDYAVAAYYFVVGPDGESIEFFAKLTGVIPENIPSSSYSTSEMGWKSGIVQHSVNFKASFFEEFDPMILYEFNELVGANERNFLGNDKEIWRKDEGIYGENFVTMPYVKGINTDKPKLKFQ